ncbi:HAD family hydrolase [Marinobacter lutaoensis]|uniref:HAD family hydrolase n=1 Tax=Marinobacter lutaoensis TaxID=135739 RepID=UPI00159386E3|nr:HAD-IIB family hydrolase [Marinobacter lutaoensis]NVD37029.1 HAD family phosphatase [Marinobacter lutaoensis]
MPVPHPEATTPSRPPGPSPLPERLEHHIRYLFTDVDDTLTWQGRLPVETFVALDRLQRAGIQVIPVTGACAGWCDCIARTWPVSAVIGENGAFWIQPDSQGAMRRTYRQPLTERRRNRALLHHLQQQLIASYDFARPTDDQPYRETDIAFDIGQQWQASREDQQRLLTLLHQAGVQARLSSIHINAWLGNYDKASSAKTWLEQEAARTGQPIAAHEVAFIGDSGNDATMFTHFHYSVGVANITPFLDNLPHPPRYITSASGGFGFAEFAERLLK